MAGSGQVRVAVVIFLLQAVVIGQSANNRIETIASALRNREFDSALQLLQPALQASPRDPQLWMFQGLAYSGKGDQKSALNSYQSALKVSPDYLPSLEGAAQLQYEAGNPEAAPLLQHVLRLRPNDATTHAMLAVIAYKENDCAAAVEHFSRSESRTEIPELLKRLALLRQQATNDEREQYRYKLVEGDTQSKP